MASLTQLQYLVAVDRLRHFGKAAKACHVSQPTLSMQLHKLEEEYGVVFFDRGRQPILPTPEGAAIIEQAKAVLREASKLDHLGKSKSAEPKGDFRLALIPTIAPYLLPIFLGAFAKKYPEVNLFVEELTTENILESLARDRIDAGILATPLPGEKLMEKPLYYEPFWVFAAEGHPLLKLAEVSEDRLEAKDIWLLAEGHCLRNQIVRLCGLRGQLKTGAGTFRNVRLESGSLETVIHLVEQGHGYTLLPHLAAKALMGKKKVQLKPFAKPVPAREVSLVTNRSQYKAAILEALAREIQAHLPEDLPRAKSKAIEVVRI